MFGLPDSSQDSVTLIFEGRSQEEERLLTALHKEGNPIAVSSRNNTWTFSGSGLEDLKGLQWERRKIAYSVPVKFRNINLLTGQKAEMVIEVGSMEYERMQKRSTSYYNMSLMGMALINYFEEHNGLLPEGISAEAIRPYFEDDEEGKLFDWVQQNVQFLDRGMDVKTMTIDALGNTPVAYDKVLLQEIEYTVVYFVGGYQRGVERENLNRYGIDPDKE